MNTPPVTIRTLTGAELRRRLADLSAVLIDCVDSGASVGFMAPLGRPRAEAFWAAIAAEIESGARCVLAAEQNGILIGTVQLILAQPDNQPHRADLAKMLVHSQARRQGIGTALLRAAEHAAIAAGKTLLVLDTASDDAERVYVALGWIRAGTIPGYALLPYGGLVQTALYYRVLPPTGRDESVAMLDTGAMIDPGAMKNP